MNFILLPLFLLFYNIKNTFVHFTDVNHVVLLEYCSWNWMTSWCWVLKKINPFGRYVKKLLIHVHCTWLDESISEWVKRMVCWGLSLLSGLITICEVVNSVGQGRYIRLSGKSQGKFIKFQKPLALATMLQRLQPLFSLTVVLFFHCF